jgi:signal transduction histidine kinase
LNHLVKPQHHTKFWGTGLGLPIVKRLLLLFDTHIHLESEQNKGSHFYFVINFKLEATCFKTLRLKKWSL